MYTFTTDYRKDDGRGLVNRGLFINGLPRPILLCRMFGHKPVVDGTGTLGERGHLSRWVTCDRCGTRPSPQGRLDPAVWNVGEKYTGQYVNTPANVPETAPGSWPKTPTWDLSVQLCIGSSFPGFGAQAKVGSCGSENATAAHLRIGRAFAIYIDTGELGRFWQRRLNPTGYESKVVELSIGHGHIHWKLLAPRDSSSRHMPRWRDGSIRYRLLDILLGEKRYSYEDVGGCVTATLKLPHGDTHEILMQLRRRARSRKRTRARFDGWTIDWDTQTPPGIPTKPGGLGNVSGASIPFSPVEPDAWQSAALAGISKQLTDQRDRYGYAEES